ncbi:hypothetical protein B0H17DRAFT_1149174 [Mycena rosella]|uniref:Uncharacterized protein n=1 Tax=Mycena rosella TaxID=1033263 RepID=A0AAD7C664_MYCRO|nr:hypothetical protein B0H17DRAFT_1149174 [Mycena rosella]
MRAGDSMTFTGIYARGNPTLGNVEIHRVHRYGLFRSDVSTEPCVGGLGGQLEEFWKGQKRFLQCHGICPPWFNSPRVSETILMTNVRTGCLLRSEVSIQGCVCGLTAGRKISGGHRGMMVADPSMVQAAGHFSIHPSWTDCTELCDSQCLKKH